MHIFGYVTDGFQSLNHSAVLSSLVFLGVLVVYVRIMDFGTFGTEPVKNVNNQNAQEN